MDDVKPKTEFWPLFTTGNFRRDNDKTNGSLGLGTRDTPKGLDPGLKEDLHKLYVTDDTYVQVKFFRGGT